MRVLGLNGWPGRGHDTAACIVVDGLVVAVAEEERFIRQKHAYGAAPLHCAAFCLAKAGLTLDDIDVVAFGWDIPRLHHDRGIPWGRDDAEALEELLPKAFFPRSRDPRLEFITHHLAHAASVYHLSGDDEAAILVIDGQGEVESASLMRGKGGRIETLDRVPASWSLGYFYDAVGQFIGLGADQAGKLMGLAAYGTVQDDSFGAIDIVDGGYRVRDLAADLRSRTQIDDNDDVVEFWLRRLETWSPLPPNLSRRRFSPETGRFEWVTDRDPFDYRDLAAGAQQVLERAVFAMVDRLMHETGCGTLHVAGGVGFNATLNGKLLQHPSVGKLFVQPLAGDAGVAIGAALDVAWRGGDSIAPMTTSIGWGIEFSPGTIRAVLDRHHLSYEECDDIAAETAKRIATGAVVGWFQGPGEVGPRALGHRSILADPARRETRDHINLQIKSREWWRPLAPSMTYEGFQEYIDADCALPYMIVTRPLTPEARTRLEAVDHVDGTTRPQTVHAEDEPLYHRLLHAVGENTGARVVLNTSFNGNDEPIVWTPTDAVRTFGRLRLDALAIGPFLINRR